MNGKSAERNKGVEWGEDNPSKYKERIILTR